MDLYLARVEHSSLLSGPLLEVWRCSYPSIVTFRSAPLVQYYEELELSVEVVGRVIHLSFIPGTSLYVPFETKSQE